MKQLITTVVLLMIIHLNGITQTFITIESSQEYYKGEILQKIIAKPPIYNKITLTDSLFVILECKMMENQIIEKYHLQDFVMRSTLSNEGYVVYLLQKNEKEFLELHFAKENLTIKHFGIRLLKDKNNRGYFKHKVK